MPIGRPETQSRTDGERETAGPAEEAGQLPAAEERIGHRVHSAAVLFAAAKGQFIHPVGVYLVSGIKVRNSVKSVGLPSVDDLAAQAESFEFIDALGIGTNIG